jgi:metal-sulfur cluster biosynthetic enzyme
MSRSPAPREAATLAEAVGGPAAPDDLIEQLRYVLDPELGIDVVSLGLVYDVRVVEGVAEVLMTTTTPACPVGSYLTDAVRWALLDLERVERVEVELTHQPRWSPRMMSDEAKARLGWTR